MNVNTLSIEAQGNVSNDIATMLLTLLEEEESNVIQTGNEMYSCVEQVKQHEQYVAKLKAALDAYRTSGESQG